MSAPAAAYGAGASGSLAQPRAPSVATAWALSGLAGRRAGAVGAGPVAHSLRLRRWLVRFAVWVEILGGLARVHPDGTAVVTVAPPRRRDQRRMFLVVLGHDVAVVAALVLAWLWWPPAAVGGVGLLVLALAVAVATDHRPRQVARRLGEATPNGAHHIRNFFAEPAKRGAGRVVLDGVCREADQAGRVLYLDTVAERLVAYYGEFGFEARATVQRCRGGETVLSWRMVREPRADASRPGS